MYLFFLSKATFTFVCIYDVSHGSVKKENEPVSLSEADFLFFVLKADKGLLVLALFIFSTA